MARDVRLDASRGAGRRRRGRRGACGSLLGRLSRAALLARAPRRRPARAELTAPRRPPLHLDRRAEDRNRRDRDRAPLAPRRHERPQPRGVPPAGRDLSRHRRAGRLAHARAHAGRGRLAGDDPQRHAGPRASRPARLAARLGRPGPDPARPAALRRRHPRGRRRLRRRARRDRALARRQRARHRRHPRPRRRHAVGAHPRRQPGAGAEGRGADPAHRVRVARPRPGAGRARHRRRPGREPAVHPADRADARRRCGRRRTSSTPSCRAAPSARCARSSPPRSPSTAPSSTRCRAA